MFTERLHLIVDNKKSMFDYKYHIDFVHSFGLKCDSVGWCTIKIESESTFNLLEQIHTKAKETNGKVRVCYEKKEFDIDTDWYILKPNKKIEIDYDDYSTPKGIKGYKIPPQCHIAHDDYYNYIIVDEELGELVKPYCNLEYIYDTGRFNSKSFYILMPEQYFKNICYIAESKKNCYKEIDHYNGNLERISKYVDEVQLIDFPIMVENDDAITDNIAFITTGIYINSYAIRRVLAQKLIESKLISKSELIPVRYCDKKNHKHLISKSKAHKLISDEILSKWKKDKDKLDKKNRPTFSPTEKLALQALRKAKKERQEDFNRALSKVFLEKIDDELLLSISSIYKVTNGCYINEDTKLISYNEIDRDTKDFIEEIKQDEALIDQTPKLLNAKKIGRIANGDSILLFDDGEVIIFDHEEPNNNESFKDIWQFIYDRIE